MTKKLLISPYSKQLRNGKRNAKNYPYWQEVIDKMKDKGWEIWQLGMVGEELFDGVDSVLYNYKLADIKRFVSDCDVWVSVDNFFPHLAHDIKPGIVIWGRSNPDIYGYDNCRALFVSRDYFLKDQFGIWESVDYTEDCFVKADVVIEAIERFA